MELFKKIAMIAVGSLLGLWFLAAGAQKFLARPAFEEMFTDFGLPLWSVSVIGVIELIGAVLVLVPRTALYGAGLIGVVMIGALACHLLSGSGSPVPSLVAVAMATLVGGMRFLAQRRARFVKA